MLKQHKPIPRSSAQRGATVIEYALIAALIAIAVAAVMGPLGTAISGKFTEAETTLTGGGS
jgi:Flp pilus assembly pilin Flp